MHRDENRIPRCNPLDPKYLKVKNVNTIAEKMISATSDGQPFSACSTYLAAGIEFLRDTENGRYCTIPHLKELMCRSWREVVPYLNLRETGIGRFVFGSDGDSEMMMQAIASTVSLCLTLVTSCEDMSYWILTGDDFADTQDGYPRPAIPAPGPLTHLHHRLPFLLYSIYADTMIPMFKELRVIPCNTMTDRITQEMKDNVRKIKTDIDRLVI